MAPPVPRSKLSRALLAKAREWRDVINELPLLEQYDSLEEAIKGAGERQKVAEQLHDAAQARVKELTDKEKVLRDSVAEHEARAAQLKLQNDADAATSRTAANASITLAREEAQKQAAQIVADAQKQADKIKADGQAAADAYKLKLKGDVAGLEKRVASLTDDEAKAKASHERASRALSSIKAELGVGS